MPSLPTVYCLHPCLYVPFSPSLSTIWMAPLPGVTEPKDHALTASVPSLLPGPPAPPQDVTVQAGATAAIVQVSWKPPALTPTGLSNGANVTGYGVYAKGQRVSMGCEALLCRGRLGEGEGGRFSGENLRLFQLQVSTSRAFTLGTVCHRSESEEVPSCFGSHLGPVSSPPPSPLPCSTPH